MSTVAFIQQQSRRAAGRVVPAVLAQRFDPSRAVGLSTVFELRVTGPGGVIEDRFAVLIDDGALTVERRAAPEAVAWVAVGLRDMIGLVDGTVGPWELMAAKRLDIGGEPYTALRFPTLFRLT